MQRAYADLAAFQTERGDLAGAIRSWSRSREYTSNVRQTAECSTAIIELAVLARSWPTVEQNLHRLDVVNEGRDNPV